MDTVRADPPITSLHLQSPTFLATGKKEFRHELVSKHDVYYDIPHVAKESALFPMNEQFLKKMISFPLTLLWQVQKVCRTYVFL